MRRTLSKAMALGVLLALSTAMQADASPKGCPPGLAKKSVPCVPPGQVNKGWKGDYDDGHDDDDDDDDDGDHDHVTIWHTGDVLPGDVNYLVINAADWPRYNLLQPNDGGRYILVGNEILQVSRDTLTVIAFVRLWEALAN